MDQFNRGLQQLSLTKQLKKILDQYPDNGQILKELIQNAEDAGATEIKFLLDHTQYGAAGSKLCDPGLAKFQGPALYAYNDAEFTDDDWQSIRLVCDSLKEHDAMKVGRFGLGFKSVYHMTDLPSFITGKGIGFIDPHVKYFLDDDKSRPTSCRLWHLDHNKTEISKYSDQFQPFISHKLFGTGAETFKQKNYAGRTLFRFPLRNLEGSGKSELSNKIYTAQDVHRLFRDLENDAGDLMTFLKNLKRIEIYEKFTTSAAPAMIFEIHLEDGCFKAISKKRDEFWDVCRGMNRCSAGSHTSVTYPVIFESNKPKYKKYKFIVTLYNGTSDLIAKSPEEKARDSLKVLPVVGVALPLNPENSPQSNGRIFCFLPLPLEGQSPTGFKIHINGYFAVEQNRKHLKWPAGYWAQIGPSDYDLIWNSYLMKNLVPKAMVDMALSIVNLEKDGTTKRLLFGFEEKKMSELMFLLMPDLNSTTAQWKPCEEMFYKNISDHAVFYSEIQTRWPLNSVNWLSIRSSETIVDDSGHNTALSVLLRKILLNSNNRLVLVPKYVIDGIEKYNKCSLQKITAKLICQCLKNAPTQLDQFVEADKFLLLKYLLSDLSPINMQSGFDSNMLSLKLLPLDDGSWIAFAFAYSEKIFVPTSDSPQSLLPGLNRRFIKSSMEGSIKNSLQSLARKGSFQLQLLNENSVLELLNKVQFISLPNTFGTATTIVVKNTHDRRSTMNWLKQIWNYFVEKKESINFQEEIVSLRLRLIPVDEGESLALLDKNLPLISAGVIICKDLLPIFTKLGIIVLKNLPSFVTDHPDVMGTYILRTNVTDIVEALRRIQIIHGVHHLKMRFNGLSSPEKIRFRDFVGAELQQTSKAMITDTVKKLLKALPMFQTLDQSGFKNAHYCSVDTVSVAVTKKCSIPLPIPQIFLHLSDHFSKFLADILYVTLLSEADILVKFIFPQLRSDHSKIYKHADIIAVMKYVLGKLDELSDSLTNFTDEVKQIKFISFNRAEPELLERPDNLFDNNDQILKSLFFGKDVFPCGVFSNVCYKTTLIKLGLKNRWNVTLSDLLAVAKVLHWKNPDEDTFQIASALMTVLNDVIARDKQNWNFHNTISEFLNIKWVVPQRQRSHDYPEWLQFFGETRQLVSPGDVCSDKYVDIIGSVQATVNIRNFKSLADQFGWSEKPKPNKAVGQLNNIISCFRRHSNSPGKRKRSVYGNDINTTDVKVTATVKKLCDQIYGFFEDVISSNNHEFLDNLTSEFIFVDEEFFSKTHCALECSLGQTCLPFICGLPKIMADSYRNLWTHVGIKRNFEFDDYVCILQNIHDNYYHEYQPLTKHHLQIVLHLVHECCANQDEQCTGWNTRNVFLPDSKQILRPSHDLHFDDSPWIAKDDDTYTCHPKIPYGEAKMLGVTSIRHHVLKSCRKTLPGFSFGQNENLVNRLRRILSSYPLDEGIMKELIQNADDAGATKIHFIFDSRNLSNEKVFDDRWKSLQGPAFCVYNDVTFTDDDLKGIQNLGEGSKSNEITKIGQYGVGFNCIYHLTDVPTFLTNNKEYGKILCVLDPTLNYVPGATPDSPGYMFRSDKKFEQQFSDVFQGYLEQNYSANAGTFFRFPLRQKISPLSSNVFDVDSLKQKFSQPGVQSDMHEYFLFLNNLKEICFREVKQVHGYDRVTDIFSIKASVNDRERQILTDFRERCKKVALDLKHQTVKFCDITATKDTMIHYEMETKCSNRTTKKWLITKQLGFKNSAFLGNLNVTENEELNLLPVGGVAFLLNPTPADTKSRKLFCFLPLPEQMDIPVHVNGHFALAHESRRNLWENDKSDFRIEWNSSLMTNVIAPAYCALIVAVRDRIKTKNMDLYNSIFPNVHDKNGRYIKVLCQSVYKLLYEINEPVLAMYTDTYDLSWIGPAGDKYGQAFFEKSYKEGAEKENLQDVLISTGFRLLQSPLNIYNNFRASDVEVHCVTPDIVLDFFRGFQHPLTLCKLQNLPQLIGNTKLRTAESLKLVIRYCLKTDNFETKLNGCPLLLTQDNYLHVFDAGKPKFSSFYFDVVPHAAQEFLHSEFISILHTGQIILSKLLIEFGIADFVHLISSISVKIVDRKVTFLGLRNGFRAKNVHFSDIEIDVFVKRVWSFLRNESRNFVKNHITFEKLRSLYLLPISSNKGNCLYPISQGNMVIMPNQNYSQDILDVVDKLGIPQLDIVTMCGVIDEVVHQRYIETIERISGKQVHLCEMIATHVASFGFDTAIVLNRRDQKCLFTFVSQNCNVLRDPRSIDAIKKLPIFPAFAGNFISLNNACSYVIPGTIPTIESEIWTNVNFLKCDMFLKPFLDMLGCQTLTEVGVYSQFILPKFGSFSDLGRLKHLQFIKLLFKKSFEIESFQEQLILLKEQLQRCPILYHSSSKSLRCASSFYDAREQLFVKFESPADFPSPPYDEEEWPDFLIECGLVNVVGDRKLLDYVKRMAKNYEQENVKLIVKTLMERVWIDDSILNEIKLIKFIKQFEVPPEWNSLHEQFVSGKKSSTIAYSGSYEYKYRKLLWTVSLILPKWASNNSDLVEKLGVCTKVPCLKVCEHLKNICTSFLSNRVDNRALEKYFVDILKEIYSFLDKKIVSSDKLEEFANIALFLKNVPCVVIDDGKHLARPSQIVVDIEKAKEIRPFLYKFPTELGNLLKLFTFLGVEETPGFHHYAAVLEEMKEKSGDECLHANEKNSVLQAVSGILNILSKQEIPNGNSEEKFHFMHGVQNLILPGDDDKLHLSSELVIKDNELFADRIQAFSRPYLIDMSECSAGLKSSAVEKLLKLLPEQIQPALLSSVVMEKIEVEGLQRQPSILQGKIRSVEFRQSLLRLARDDTMSSKSNEPFSIIEMDTRVGKLANIKIYRIPTLITHLEYEGKEIPGSRMDCLYFIEKGNVQNDGIIYTVYYKAALEDDFTNLEIQQLYTCLADVLADVTGMFQNRLNVIVLLLQQQPGDMNSVLDKMKIRKDDFQITPRKPFAPPLGSFVPIDMHHLLKQDIFMFEIGDIAALEIEDDESEDPVYILVKIVEEIESKNQSLLQRKYKVNAGDDEVKIVFASDLYAFFRDKKTSKCQEIAVFDGPDVGDGAGQEPKAETNLDFAECIHKIKERLKEALNLPEEQRRKIIKRLYMQWHPDKNLDRIEFCTKVFKQLKNLIERLNKGLPLDTETPTPAKRYKSGTCDATDGSHRSHPGAFSFNFENFNNRAKKHGQNQYQGGMFYEKTTFSDFFSNSYPNPQPQEARRWIMQAEFDVMSAKNDSSSDSHEWSCYKYHQAAEKALKAIQLMRNANQLFTHNIISLCAGLEGEPVIDWVRSLDSLVPNPAAMRYPNRQNFPKTPHETFSQNETRPIAELAERIVQFAKMYISRPRAAF